MRFGLKNVTIEKINSVLTQYPQIEEAIIYGSRAKGNYKPGSDIDLTLKGKSLTSDILSTVAWQLDDLLLPYMIDLSIYHRIGDPEVCEHIDRVGKVLYRRGRGKGK